MAELTLISPAKINLFLHITSQRSDGYHNLQTVFQLLDYGDLMTFTPNSKDKITISPALDAIPTQDNLAFRSAQLLKRATGCSAGADIILEKRLPMGGGLGGGSSNAATTLLALNQLWGLNLPVSSLAKLGLKLGADVPVFVQGKSAWAEGIGEQLQSLDLPECWYLVINPGCHVNTREIFSHPDLTRNTHPIKIRAFLEQGGRNDCLPIAELLYPEIRKTRQWLGQYKDARLTGTGACVFASFESRDEAEKVKQVIPAKWSGFVARGINLSPVHQTLNLMI